MKYSQRPSALRSSVRFTLLAIAATSFSTSAFADDELDTVTVTANRAPSANVLAPISVITRSDIERLQITDLPTLLSLQPGIDIVANGATGKNSSIFMRGSNSGHVLILIDGVKWQSATSGSSAIQHIPVEQIERIEIVRGPRSGLYGSEAIGGVIQIFTRKGEQGFTPYAKIGFGSHNSKQAAAGISGGTDKTSYSINFNHQSTDGINSRLNKNPDKDGYRNNSFSAKVNHQLTDSFSLGANYFRAEGFNYFDGFSASSDYFAESVQQILSTNADWKVNDLWSLSLQLSESRDQSDNYTNGNDAGTFNTRHRFASVINSFSVTADHTVNLGFDYSDDSVEGSSPSSSQYDEESRDNKAVFVSWQGNADKQSWLLSARHDDNEAFGTANTGIAEWGYALQDNLQFTANVGTAFKAPTFNDLYYPNFGVPGLDAETSKNIGIGLQGYHADIDWSVNLYRNKIENLITYSSATRSLVQVDKAVIEGLEIELATTVLGWNVAINANLLNPTNEITGKTLNRRARRTAAVNIDNQWGDWSTGATWKLSSHRFDDVANNTRVGGYGLLDLRLAYNIDPQWSVQARVANVFDKEYQTVNSYITLDRTALLTLSYTP